MNHVRRVIAFAVLALVAAALTGAQPAAAHGLSVQAATASSRQTLPQAVDRPVLFAAATTRWWTAPVAGATCSSPRGWRWGDWHAGRDLNRYSGAPVQAAANGRVIAAGWSGGTNGGWGYRVIILHGKGNYSTLYAHGLKGSIRVHVGQWVRVGTVIMLMGSSGWSTGTHTHFGVYLGRYAPGRDIDPDRFMALRGVRICK